MCADIELNAEWKLKPTRATERAGMNSSLALEREGRPGEGSLEKRRRRKVSPERRDRLVQ